MPKPLIEKPSEAVPPIGKFMMPIDVRAFLQQQNVPEELLSKLFYMEETEIRKKVVLLFYEELPEGGMSFITSELKEKFGDLSWLEILNGESAIQELLGKLR